VKHTNLRPSDVLSALNRRDNGEELAVIAQEMAADLAGGRAHHAGP
jgi:hypothetical protein